MLRELSSNVNTSKEWEKEKKNFETVGEQEDAFSSCSLWTWNPTKPIGKERHQDLSCLVPGLKYFPIILFTAYLLPWATKNFRVNVLQRGQVIPLADCTEKSRRLTAGQLVQMACTLPSGETKLPCRTLMGENPITHNCLCENSRKTA